MQFSFLKYDYEACCKDNDCEVRLENKQRINLSNHAYSVLENDADVFLKKQDKPMSSTVINHIFRNYRETALSSIGIRLNNERNRLLDCLGDINNSPEKDRTIELLLQSYKNQLMSFADELLKVKANMANIRLDSENLSYLASDDGQNEGEFYNDNIGQYLKSVIEEYARLPYVEREKIYKKDIMEEIQLAIAGGNILKLTLITTNQRKQNNVMYVKPYCVMCDQESMYNYLVGYTSADGDEWNIGSVRISSLTDCKLKARKALSQSEKGAVLQAIQTKGVQFLSSDDEDKIKVEFTPQGESMYKKILHLRPSYVKKDRNVYEFRCTLFQAEAYFFRFGHDVKILEPEVLANKFYRRFKSAQRLYSEQFGE